MLAFVYPAMVLAALSIGGPSPWALVLFNVVVVPCADHLTAWAAPGWRPSTRLCNVLFADWVFPTYAVVQLVVLTRVLLFVSAGDHPLLEFLGIASATGIMTGTAGITAAHELAHRRTRQERSIGLALLAMVTYMHFRIEHVAGHHRSVGTRPDPGTARLGESFPSYLLRALGTGFVSSWALECNRLKRAGMPKLSLSNRALTYCCLQVAIYSVVFAFFGPLGTAFFLAQSFIAVHLLEAVNYVQHYGLVRRIGHRPGVMVSWETDLPISDLFIFNLTRHGHHHVDATVPCGNLQASKDSPKLPYSFFLMVFLALMPWLWRQLMDPRVTELEQRQWLSNRTFASLEVTR